MIGLNLVYAVAGITFALFAASALADLPRRSVDASFYALIATSFLLGDRLGDFGNGLLAIALTAIAASGKFRARPRATSLDQPRGDALFAAALVIPATALVGTLVAKQVPVLVDPKQATLVALTAGVLLALAVCYAWLRPGIAAPFRQGRRLMDDVGWAAVLPQMLAALGAVFALAGVGQVVGKLIGGAIPTGSLLGAVIAYGLGMALFTMVMGNAFAAFPVMVAAVGVPVLVRQFGADPVPVATLGMLAGFCGTLMTPMAANYNLVPAALLELRDRNAVVKTQIPTALPLLLFNLAFLWLVIR